jgi:hypothetical protein
MTINRKAIAAAVFLAGACISGAASAEMTKMVGGAATYPSKNIIQNAVNSEDNTNACRGGEGRRSRRYVARAWTLHGLRADQRRVRAASSRHGRVFA